MSQKIIQRLVLIGCIAIALFWGSSRAEAAIDLTTFTCGIPASTGKGLAIFAITVDPSTNANGEPINLTNSDLFCAEYTPTSAELISGQTTYAQLAIGSGGKIKLGSGKIITWVNEGQKWWYVALSSGSGNTLLEFKDSDNIENLPAVKFNLTSASIFSVSLRCTLTDDYGNIDKVGRCRDQLTDVSNSPNRYIYFIQVADLRNQPPGTALCQSQHGTNESSCKADFASCVWSLKQGQCYGKNDPGACSFFDEVECKSAVTCHFKEGKCQAKDSSTRTSEGVDLFITEGHKKPDEYNGPLVDCTWDGSCRSIEQLVEQAVEIADWLFSLIAGLAFIFFVYGGITMIASFGNSEKVSQGKQILVAATIGLIITFSAYVLVSFVVKAIGILPGYSPF